METIETIIARRSIRKYKKEVPPKELIELIISLGLNAPTPKAYREPRRFYVVEGEKKNEMVHLLLEEVLVMNRRGINTSSAVLTCRLMLKAPIIVFCYRRNIESLPTNGISKKEQEEDLLLVDIQSISASIQNMLLAATDMGLGSLWLGDVLLIDEKINEILQTDEKLIAAVAFGYPDHIPKPIQRPDHQLVTWV
ncbi:nitroreductase family protein [Paenibacillus borealis]|uniref:Nitroreductase domain-containing protein n=1 Tax=Paenibacillus borealis TaxID=160799 RepID=A0A089LA49_PAEBO|nr:nitroreductase family protein [Paenibacillus borealis]AIQ56950.1 hypothetical protein PBOR_08415 [Paenibacillus borealis]